MRDEDCAGDFLIERGARAGDVAGLWDDLSPGERVTCRGRGAGRAEFIRAYLAAEQLYRVSAGGELCGIAVVERIGAARAVAVTTSNALFSRRRTSFARRLADLAQAFHRLEAARGARGPAVCRAPERESALRGFLRAGFVDTGAGWLLLPPPEEGFAWE